MSTEPVAQLTLRQRAKREFIEFLFLFLYLYIAFGAIILLKAAVLHDQGIAFAPWGIAVVKAAVLAKFILLGNAADGRKHFSSRPLVWPTLYKAFSLILLLIFLVLLEEIVIGLFHHRSVADSIGELTGARLDETIASSIIVLLILIPYCAWVVLGEALGEGRLVRMFFIRREAM